MRLPVRFPRWLLALPLALVLARCGDNLTLPAEGVPTAAAIAGGDDQQGIVAAPLPDSLIVRVTDSKNRPVKDQHVAFTVISGGPDAEVIPDVATTDADGVAQAHWVLGHIAGIQVVEAKVVGTTSAALKVSFTATALAAPADTILAAAGDQQTAVVGLPLTDSLSVLVTDVYGNPIQGTEVSWATIGGGTVSSASVLSGPDGRAAVLRVLGLVSGPQSATATAAGLKGSPVTFTHTALPSVATTLVKDFGDPPPIVAPAGFDLPDSIVVQVKDDNGNGVPGRTVAWAVGLGGGTVTPFTSLTDASGKAFTRWKLGPGAGANTVTATVASVGQVTFHALATAAVPDTMFAVLGSSTTGTAGQTVAKPPSVTVTDINGNPVQGETVTFTVTAGGGTVSDAVVAGTTTTVGTDANGVAALTAWTLGATAGLNTVTATALDLGAVPLKGSPVTFTATGTAANASRLVISTAPSTTAQSGAVLAAQPAVQLQDPNGNPVLHGGVQVTVSITGGGATLIGTPTVSTDANGVATFTGLGITGLAGSYTLTFSSSGLTAAVSDPITISAGAAAKLEITTQPSTAVQSGQVFAQQPVVQVTDAAGNPVSAAGIVVTAAITPPGAGTLTGTKTATTDANGVATFSDLALTGVAGPPRTLTFTATGLTSVISGPVSLGAGVEAKLSVTVEPSATALSGAVLVRQPVIQLQDADGNPVLKTGVVVTVAITPPGTGVTLGGSLTATTDATGAATFSGLSLTGPAASYTLTFTATGLTSATSAAIVLSAGAGTTLSITTEPTAAPQSGVPFPEQPVIQLRDDGGNAVAESGVTVTAEILTGAGGVLTPAAASAQTDAAGVATFAGLTLSGTPGSYTLVFKGTGLTQVVSAAITLAAGPAKDLVMTTQPSATAASGVVLVQQPIVHIEDGTGNGLPQAGVAVTATIASGGGALGGTTTLNTDVGGVVTFTDLKITGAVGDRTLEFTATGLTPVTSTPITVGGGVAATIAKHAGDLQTATAGSPVPISPSVLVTDASGNPVAGAEVTFAVGLGAGSVAGAVVTSGADGVAEVGGWTLGPVAGANSLTATAAGLTGSPLTFTAIGVPGLLGKLAMSVQPSATAQSGVKFVQQPAIQLQDILGNTVTTPGVAISVSSPTGTLNGNTTVATNGSGVATFTNLSITGPTGSYTLNFTATGVTGVTSGSITLTAGAASRLILTTEPADTAVAGVAFTRQPVVEVQDAAGNPVPASIGVTASIASGGGSLTGTTTVNTGGTATATFTDLALNGTAGSRTLLFSAGSLVATTSTAVEVIAGAASQISANSAVTQTATVGTAVGAAPSVKVRDLSGNPVAGVTVTFAIASGGGALNGPVQLTDAGGVATVTSWALGPIAGANSVTATATGVGIAGNPVSFTATGTSGTATDIVLNAGNGQSAVAGSAVATAPSVKITDMNGNGVPGVSVTFAIGSGGGSLTGSPAISSATGIATVGSWTLGAVAGGNTLTASSTGLIGSPVTFAATGLAGSASAMVKNGGDNQSAAAGTAVATAPSVLVTDSHGNPVAGATVTFAVASGGGSLIGGTQLSNSLGVATVGSWTLGTLIGSNTLTASSTGLSGSPLTFTATATAGGASKLAFLVQPSTSVAGQSISPPVQVQIRDINGNPISNSTAAVTLAIGTNPGSGTLGGTVTVNAVAGIATFSTLNIDHVGTGYTLSASSPSLTGIVSNGFNITAGAAAEVDITTQPSATAASGAVFATQPVVQIVDALGNPVNTVVSVTATASGGTLAGTATISTNASGVGTFSGLKLTGAIGNYTLTFSSTGLTSATSTAIALSAGPATTIAKNDGDAQSAPAGSAVSIDPSVKVTDAGGNPVAGVSVTFAVASGGGSVTGASATTLASGIATVGSWTLGTSAGPNSLTATSSGLGGSPLTFTATGITGSATKLAVTTQPSASAQSGVAFAAQPVIQLQDVNSNPVAQAGVSVTVAIVSGSGTLGGTTTVTTSAGGAASFSGLSISGLVGSRTLQFTSSGLNSVNSTPIAVTAGPAATLAISAGNNQTATVGTAVTVDPAAIATDASGNPVAGVGVTFAVTGGGGTVNPTSAIVTNALGIATVTSWTLGPVAGANSLSATAAGLGGSPLSYSATGQAGTGSKLTIETQPSATAQAGVVFVDQPVIQLADNLGNPVNTPGVVVSVTIASGGGTLGGTTNATSNASGLATFTNLSIAGTVGPRTLLFAASGFVSISSTSIGVIAGPAASLAKSAGDNQSAAVNSQVATDPAVIVRDASNNPVSGVSVTFAVATGGGSVVGGSATTQSNGIATVGGWTLGPVAGSNTLTATSTGLSGSPATFTATGTAGAATQLTITTQPSPTAQSGVAFVTQPVIQLRDGGNNPVSQSGVTITAAIASGGGTLGGTLTAVTNASGAATFSGLKISDLVGPHTLGFSASGVSDATSNTITLSAGPAAIISKNAGDGQSAPAGTTVPIDPAVLVTDASGNPVGSVSVTFAVASGGGSLTGGAAATNISGIATVGSWTLGGTAGPNSLTATSAGLGGSPQTFTATGTTGSATKLAITTQPPGTAQSGVTLTTDPVVQLRDLTNNNVTEAGVNVTATVSVGGALTGTATVPTNASGQASFGDLVISGLVGNYTLTFSSSGLTAATSNTIALSAGTAAKLGVTRQPSASAASGVAIGTQPQIQLQDAAGNSVNQAGKVITASLSSGTGTLDNATATTVAGGLATFSGLAITGVVGSYTLRYDAAGVTGIVGNSTTLTPGPGSQLTITVQPPPTASSGVAFSPQPVIQLRDDAGNAVSQSGVAVTATIASGSGGTLSNTIVTTNGSGVATFTSLTLSGTSGNFTLSFGSGSLTPDVSNTIALGSGAGSVLSLSTQPSASAANGAVFATQPVIQLRDGSNNPVSQSGVNVTVGISSGGGALGGTTTVATNGSGIASFTNLSITGTIGSRTLIFSAGGFVSATSNAINITAGSATQLAITTEPPATAQSGVTFSTDPVVQLRDQSNNTVTSGGVSVTAAIASGGGTLSGTTSVTTGGAGNATFTNLVISGSVGTRTLTFSSSGLSPATSTGISVSAGGAANILLNAGNGQSATVGTSVSTDPQVKVTDGSGNPVSGVSVTFAVVSGGGTVSPTSAILTDGAGLATVTSWTLGPVAGANSLTATSSGLTGSPVTFNATGTPGGATQLTFTTTPSSSATNGVAFAQQPVLQLRDAGGNAVSSSGVNVTATIASGGGAIGGTATVATNGSGQAAFTNLKITGGVGNHTLEFTAGAINVTSGNIALSAGSATTIAANAGDNQSATVGTAVAIDPQVLVTDVSGNPVSGVSVTFAAASGGGSVTGGGATTNGSGLATVGSWTLGNTAGANTLTATSSGLSGSPVTFSATGTAGGATQLTFTTTPSSSATNGVVFAQQPVLQLRDAGGNAVNTAGVNVTASIASGGGSLTGSTVTVGTNGSGQAAFTNLKITGGVGNHTLQFTAGAINVTSGNIALSAGSATTIAANAGDNQSATVGTAVAIDPQVLVTDVSGNPVSGVSVTFAVASGGGSVGGGGTTTNGSGLATVGSWTLGSTAGANTLTATSGSLSGSPVTFSATGTAGGATQLTFTTTPSSSATNGVAFAQQPVLQLRDAGGNPVSTSGVNVTATIASGGGAIGGTATVATNGSGQASFTNLKITGSVGNHTLQFTAGAINVTSGNIALSAGSATTIAANAGDNQSATVGTAVATDPQVLVTDVSGNPVSGVSVTFAVGSGGGSVGGGSQTTDVNGLATVGSWTLGNTAGANTLTATSGSLSGSPVTFSATGTAGSATQLTFTTTPSSSATNAVVFAQQPVLQLRDAGGNPVNSSGVNVTATIASGGGTLGGTATVATNASGQASFSNLKITGTAGNHTLQFTAGAINVTSGNIAVAAGSATDIAINDGDGQTATAGSAVSTPPSVKVTDVSGNVVSGVGVTFAVASGGGSATGTSTNTNGAGIATVGSWTLGTTAGPNSLTATSAGLNGSPLTFNATGAAGGANKLSITTQPSANSQNTQQIGQQPVVRLLDSHDNPVNSSGVSISVSLNGGGTLGGTTAVSTNGSGVASFTNLSITGGTGNKSLTFSSSGLTGATSGTISLTPGPATTIALSGGNSQSATVNTAVAADPSVFVSDVSGNGVDGVSVTFAVNSGGGSVGGGSQTTSGGGFATVGNWTLGTTAGPNTLNASSSGLGGSPVTFTASGVAGPATAAQSTANIPANGSILSPSTITIQAIDQFGNSLTVGGTTFVVSVTGGTTVTPTVNDNNNGTYSASYQPATLLTDDHISVTLSGNDINGSPADSAIGL